MKLQVAHHCSDPTHPASYYAATRSIHRTPVRLAEDRDTDVCIIGGGFTGLSAGIYLQELGYPVIILEGAQVGWGASGRNGGQLINGMAGNLDNVESVLGARAGQLAKAMYPEGVNLVRKMVASYNIQCDLKSGNMALAITRKQFRNLSHAAETLAQCGIQNFEILDRSRLGDHVGSNYYQGGLIDYTSGHLHPLDLALGEAKAFERLGGMIYEQSPAIAVARKSNTLVVKTPAGSVRCHKVILAGNAYLGLFEHAVSSQILPVYSEIVVTEPLGKLAGELLPTDVSAYDIRHILDYYRLTADRRMLFGSSTSYGEPSRAEAGKNTRSRMVKVFPQLRTREVEYVWRGCLAITVTRMPQLGRIEPDVYYAQGYSGHGINCTHLFGKLLSEAISGDSERFDVFAKMPQKQFPGGNRLRVPITALAAKYFQFKDWIGA